MAWIWSYSSEELHSIRQGIHALDVSVLRTILAEWAVWHKCGEDARAWDQRCYVVSLNAYHKAPSAALSEDVWREAERFRTADNGGRAAWVCPYGCHTVQLTGELLE